MKYLLALAVLVAVPVHAQTPIEPVEISAFAGYLFGGPLSHLSQPQPFSQLVVSDHFTFGVRVGFNATSRIQPELQWSRTETEMNFDARENGPHLPVTIDYFLAGANYHFSAGPVRPYVALSLGAATLRDVRITSEGLRPATNFAGSVGVCRSSSCCLTPVFGSKRAVTHRASPATSSSGVQSRAKEVGRSYPCHASLIGFSTAT